MKWRRCAWMLALAACDDGGGATAADDAARDAVVVDAARDAGDGAIDAAADAFVADARMSDAAPEDAARDAEPDPVDAAPDGTPPDMGPTPIPDHVEPDDRDNPFVLRFDADGYARAVFELTEADQDWFAIRLEADAELVIEAAAEADPADCAGDVTVAFYPSNAPVAAFEDEEEGPGACPRLSSAVNGLRAGRGEHLIALTGFLGRPAGRNLLTVRRALRGDAPCTEIACAEGLVCRDEACAAHECGDGILGPGEACDDENLVAGDGCTACQVGPVEPGFGCSFEGPPCVDGAFCSDDGQCQTHACGDDVLAASEGCDDGNEASGDGCDACELVPIGEDAACVPGGFRCADGLYCDEGAAACVAETCGDGARTDSEECEDCEGCRVDVDTPRHREPDGSQRPFRLELVDDEAEVLFMLNPAGDEDWFVFTPSARSILTVETLSWTGFECEGDTYLTLFGPDGSPLAEDDDDGEGTCSRLSPEDQLPILEPVDYRLQIYELFGEPTGPNLLRLRLIPLRAGDEDCDVAGQADRCDDGLFCNLDGVCAAHRCGDGVVGPGEGCDDGNDEDRDGCTALCASAPVELGFRCSSRGFDAGCVEGGVCDARRAPPVCVRSRCGDGIPGPNEACDDANARADDGCSPDCQTVGPFAAEPDDRENPYLLGVAVIFQIDQPGDHDWFRFVLDEPAAVGLQVRDASDPQRCSGDPVLDLFRAGEEEPFAGDDDGGAGFCPLLSPLDLPAGTYDVRLRAYDAEAGTTGPNLLELGTPAVIVAGEECVPGDGVAACEEGTYCPAFGAPRCSPHVCGDGVVAPDESCDDGNELDDDGCTPACESVEIALGRPCDPERGTCVEGAYCPSVGGVDPTCVLHRCGDGVAAPDEPCDDGNGDNADGCTNDCRIRPRADLSDGGEFLSGFGAGSFDAFDLRLPEEQVLRVRLDDGAGACPADALFELYRLEDGEYVFVTSDDDTFELCPVLDLPLDPGAYRLLVRGFDGQGVAQYRLLVEFAEVGGPGFPCVDPEDCQVDLLCLLGEAPGARRCGEPPLDPEVRGDGALCDVEALVADCGERECWTGDFESLDGRCADRLDLEEGDNDGGFDANGLDLWTLDVGDDGIVELRVTDDDGGCPGDATLAVLLDGEEIAANDDAVPGDVCPRVVTTLGAGLYDVVVAGFGGGAIPAYVLRYRFVPPAGRGEACPRAFPSCDVGLLCAPGEVPGTGTCVDDVLLDEEEPNDVPADDLLEIAPGEGMRAAVEGDDLDVFAVVLEDDATIVVHTGDPDTGACNLDTVLYRIDGEDPDLEAAFAVNDDVPGLGTCSRLIEDLPAGRHFYAIESFERSSDFTYGVRIFVAAEAGEACDPQRLFSHCGPDLGCTDAEGAGDGVCAP